VNIVLKGLGRYREALAEQSVFALEAYFAPEEHRLKEGRPKLPYVVDGAKLAASATGRSEADWSKAAKIFADEPAAAKKKAFHALRVPMFAQQIATAGRIHDFSAAASLWAEIRESAASDWGWYERAYGPIRARLCEELTTKKTKKTKNNEKNKKA